MAATIIICLLIGRWIDDYREQESKLFTAVFSIFGVLAAFYNLYRSITKND